MKENIAIIAGGDSSEYIVSVKSGANVFSAIDTELFTPWFVEIKGDEWCVKVDDKIIANINRADFSFIYNEDKIKFDFAYIIIHGTPGENGILQGYFDMLKVPYSTCDVASSALTFNKFFCNNYLLNLGVKIAPSIVVTQHQEIDSQAITKQLGLPLFVKPNAGGSSFGVTKVKDADQLQKAINSALKECSEVMIESFIDGKEFTCGLMKLSDQEMIFPITEVLPKNEFFDFEAKYVASKVEEITPARLSEELTEKCKQISSNIYDLCRCSGIVRVDYILKDNEFYFLEVNTTPGMTATSFIPQQIEAMGMQLSDVLTLIINDKLNSIK